LNETNTYEQLIAKKLNAIAIPDMADAIWHNIELGLNVPAINDQPIQTQVAAKVSAKILITTKTILVIGLSFAILVLAFMYVQTKRNTPPKKEIPKLNTAPVTTIDSNNKIKSNIEIEGNKDKKILSKKINTLPDTSSQYIEPVINHPTVTSPLKIDSNKVIVAPNLNTPLKINPLKLDSPAKKAKGVKGISNDDYKIQGIKKKPSN
jgi:hypothetical protein